jgi:hypothetical protein
MEQRIITDKFGTELRVGDTVCFTISMRVDNKPLVRATISEIRYGKNQNLYGEYTDWLLCDFTDCPEVQWAKREDKLPGKISPKRVVKCY